MDGGFVGFSDAELARIRHPTADVATGSGENAERDSDEETRHAASAKYVGETTKREPSDVSQRRPFAFSSIGSNILPSQPKLPSSAFFGGPRSRESVPSLSPCSSPSLSRPASAASSAAAAATSPRPTAIIGDVSLGADIVSPVKMEMGTKGEQGVADDATSPELKNEQGEFDLNLDSSLSQGKVTAIAVVAPSDHKIHDEESISNPSPPLVSAAEKSLNERDNQRTVEDEEAIRRQLQNVEAFREHQRQMEEANRMRREMLSAALEAKRRATNAEQHKLQVVQRELQSLDQQLNVDVSILRDKIEEASRDYLEAQKVFETAEAEYIRAKMDLHRKTEMKERLTEHLCVIIQENELRKARKLAELMAKLEIDCEEYLDLTRSQPRDSFPQQVLESIQSINFPHGRQNRANSDSLPAAASPPRAPPEVLITPAPPRSDEEQGVPNTGSSDSMGVRGSPLPHSVTANHSRFSFPQPMRSSSSPGGDSGILTTPSTRASGSSPISFSNPSPFFCPPLPESRENRLSLPFGVGFALSSSKDSKDSDEYVDVEGGAAIAVTPFEPHLGAALAASGEEPMDTGTLRRDSGISLAPSSTDRRFSGDRSEDVMEEADEDGARAIDLSRRNSASCLPPPPPACSPVAFHHFSSLRPASNSPVVYSPHPHSRSPHPASPRSQSPRHLHSPLPGNRFEASDSRLASSNSPCLTTHTGLLPPTASLSPGFPHSSVMPPNVSAWSSQTYLPLPQITTGWNSSGGSQQSLASPSTLSTSSSPGSEQGSPVEHLSPNVAIDDAAVRRKYSLQEERLVVPRREEHEIRRNSTGSANADAYHLSHAPFFNSSLPGSSQKLFPISRPCRSPSSPRRPFSPSEVDSQFDPNVRLKAENYNHHHRAGAVSPGALSPGGVPPWQKQTIQLWQFLRELLMEPQAYSSAIRWVDKQKGIFKIDDSNLVATLWGKRKNRPAMNYDKLSRSIRQYYKKGIIKKTDKSQRLVYQFCQPYRPI